MTYDNILYETDGRLAFITLNRPEKLNALSNDLRGELFHALKEAEADRSVGVIVLRANGRAFSAGYDLSPSRAAAEGSRYVHPRSMLPDTNTTHPAHYDWSRHVLLGNWIIWELSKPVVAQVQGYCLAGGTELATFCDFRIVAEDAQVGYPPVRAMGTMDIMWAPWHLPMTKAREFAYVGDSILGHHVNLGAGTKLSNLGVLSARDPATGRRPTIKLTIDGRDYDTGLTKFGAILGDGAQTGCNAVLNPGCIVGPGTLVYANASLRKGFHPAHSIIKLRQNLRAMEREGA